LASSTLKKVDSKYSVKLLTLMYKELASLLLSEQVSKSKGEFFSKECLSFSLLLSLSLLLFLSLFLMLPSLGNHPRILPLA
jgi:hypothetical protein